jgi:ATP-dependent Lon protease
MTADEIKALGHIPLLTLRGVMIVPQGTTPLLIGRPRSVASVQQVKVGDHIICIPQKDDKVDDPTIDDLYHRGTIAKVIQMNQQPEGRITIMVRGEAFVRLNEVVVENGVSRAKVSPIEFQVDETQQQKIIKITKDLRRYVRKYAKLKSVKATMPERYKEPLDLAYLVFVQLQIPTKPTPERFEQLLNLLNETTLEDFLGGLFDHLEKEVERLDAEHKSEARKRREGERQEYYLNDQRARREMGGDDTFKSEMEELEAKVQEKVLPPPAREKVDKELRKLKMMSPMGAEATVVRNYIEWILSLPWAERSDDKTDIAAAEEVLNADHYALKKPKERILEHLAVHSLTQELSGPILCLVGPPGVGKTSLVRSIARSMGREFVRMSLGGVRDEAEIRGHRRTYIGAMPGKIIQSLKKVGTNNPVLLLDEIDKMSTDFRGDPSSALLEVLDPEQNSTFNDHYVDLDYDLSQVMFITTANNRHQIPLPLQDRLEMIEVSGYTEVEKLNIIKRHLLPKQVDRHGIKSAQVSWIDSALKFVINRYTRESGVRNLERQIASICRKIARDVIAHQAKGGVIEDFTFRVDSRRVQKLLGSPPYSFGVSDSMDEVGLVNGLAYTSWGGNLLQAEVTMMEGAGKLMITGQLGEVMQESARAAMSYVRSRALDLGLEPKFHQECDFHLHFPEGAIPKDGPSAGVTMVTGLVSAIKGLLVRRDVAMTGEITLRGRVLPIGGLKEKLLAAKRGGIKTVFIPKENIKDLDDVPSSVCRALEIIGVERVDEILEHAYVDASPFGESRDDSEAKENSMTTKSTAKKSTAKKSTAKKSTAKKSTAKTPTAKKPTAKTPTAKKPTAKKPTAKKPAAKKPAAKKPAAKKPAAKKPAAKKPAAKKPATKKSTAKKRTKKTKGDSA